MQENTTQALATAADLTKEIESLQGSVTHFQEKWPKMVKRAQAIQAGFSKLSEPKTDAEDQALETFLANTRKYRDMTKEDRLAGTKEFDNIKARLMQPEKELDAIFEKGKEWRDNYAKFKAAERQKELDAIKLKEDKANEISRIGIEMERSINNGIISLVMAADNYLSQQYASLSIDNYATVEAVFNKQPSLSMEKYVGFVSVAYNQVLVSGEEYKAIASGLPAALQYDAVNKDYSGRVQSKLNDWLPKLPARLKELQELAELAAKNAQAAAELAAKQKLEAEAAEKLRLETEAKAAEELAAKQNAELAAKQADEKLNHSFNAQIATQQLEDQDGLRKTNKGVLVADETMMVATIADLFYEVFINPKYKGIFEKEKSGELKRDADGDLQPVKWLADLLDFYAKECSYLNEDGTAKIPGIKIKQTLSTVQRSKK